MPALALPQPPIADAVLRLRPFEDRDIPRVVAACRDPLTRRFLPDLPDPYSEARAAFWIAGHEPARAEGDALTLALADRGEDRALGAITASLDAVAARAELGYWLAPDARGHGHMTRAVRLLVPWLFEALGLARLQILTDPANHASGAVAERAGFRREGHLRDYLCDQDGVLRDSIMWGRLPGDPPRPGGDPPQPAGGGSTSAGGSSSVDRRAKPTTSRRPSGPAS